MKPIHVAATIVRLFAISLLIYTVVYFVNSLVYLSYTESSTINVINIVFSVAMLIVSIVLWVIPVSISRRITAVPTEMDDQKLDFTQGEFLSICIFALGLYFLHGLITEGVFMYMMLSDPALKEVGQQLSYDQKASLWAWGLQALFILVLLVGNRRLVQIFKALRYGGQ